MRFNKFSSFIVLILLAGSLSASEFISGEGNVVPKGKIIDDDLYLTGNYSEVYGEITGDLTAFCFDIESEAEIGGSCLLIGWNIGLGGVIQNSARLVGNNIDIMSDIGGNILAFGEEINIDRDAIIEKDLTCYGDIVNIEGTVKGDIIVKGGSVFISGHIEGNAEIDAEDISIQSPGVIGGDLKYISNAEMYIEDGARVEGRIDWDLPRITEDSLERLASNILSILKVLLFFMSLITGFGLILFFRNHTREASNQIHNKFWQSLGIGFLAFIIFLGGSVLLIAVIVGIPLGMILIGLGMVLFYVGKIYVAIVVGRLIFGFFSGKRFAIGWEFIIGLLVLTIIFQIPVLGTIAYIVVFLVGAGGAIAAEMYISAKFRESLSASAANPQE